MAPLEERGEVLLPHAFGRAQSLTLALVRILGEDFGAVVQSELVAVHADEEEEAGGVTIDVAPSQRGEECR